MTTTVKVSVPQDASYTAQVVLIDQRDDGPSATSRAVVQPGTEQTFHAHSTRVIEVSEEPIPATQV